MNLNKVFLIGGVTRDTEMRSLPSGDPVAEFGLATNRSYEGKDGHRTDTEFHNIVVFGNLAKFAGEQIKKSMVLLVEGRLQTRSWESGGIKKFKTEIVAENIQLAPKPKLPLEG